MDQSLIVYIIIAYKPDLTKLKHVLQALQDATVILVDNGGLGAIPVPSKTVLVRPEKNLGYGGGVNAGMREALKFSPAWIVVLNQDTSLSPDGIRVMEKFLQRSPPAVTGPFTGLLDPRRWTTILSDTDSPDYISGSCMAIHVDVARRIGYFHEPYFMYYEEVDYCVRARNAGFPFIRMPVPGIGHEDSASLGRGSHAHEYYLARNHMLFVERLAPLPVKLHEYLRLPKTVYEYLRDTNSGGLSGIKDYFLRKFGKL